MCHCISQGKTSLNIFILALVFIVFSTLFMLNYMDNSGVIVWNPKHIMNQFSAQYEKLKGYTRKPCSCSSCVSEQGISLWFDEKFNQSVELVLTPLNGFISEETYKWWQRLQQPRTEEGINETIQELFQLIPGDKDQLLETQTTKLWCSWCKRCRRCAVVGNSHNLRRSYYGEDIDNHDFVFRMNRAPTLGFEIDVGKKTTHRFVYPESYEELADNGTMVIIPFKTLDLLWVISALTTGTINYTYNSVPTKINVTRDKILIYHPHFIKYVYDTWLQHHGAYPSTGFLTLILALRVCDEVDLYGFGADSNGNWHHYWETNSTYWAHRKSGVHHGNFESNITLTLASVNKIRIFMGR